MSNIQTGGPPRRPPLAPVDVAPAGSCIFWLVRCWSSIALLWLLNDVLLPFVAGMALAYLLDPLVQRLQRLGLNRAIARSSSSRS